MITTLSTPLRGLVVALVLGGTTVAAAPLQELVEREQPGPIDGLVAFHGLGLNEALAEAKRTDKVVMVDFYADWCVPCHKLDKMTWRHPEVVEWLKANTVAIKVDAEVNFSQKQRYDVHAFPTMVFVRPDGTKIDMHVGYLDPVDFIDMGNKTLFGKSTIELAKQAADAEPDVPMLRKVYADKLAQRFRYKEALDAYLWCLDEGVARSPGFASYRDSFLLTDIARVGQRFPAANKALRERAAAAEADVLAGRGTVETARHLAALNRVSGGGADTYRVWNAIRDDANLDDALADVMFDDVFDVLLAERRYDDIAASVGDVFARIDERIQRYWMSSQSMGEDVDEELATILREAVVKDGARYFEATLGAGQAEAAQRVAAKLIEFQRTGRTYAALIAAAARAGDVATAQALGEQGLAELSRGQHSSIKRALRKLPEQS